MKFKFTLVALTLALAGGAASAATIGTLYDLTELNATGNTVALANGGELGDRKSTRLNSSHSS